MPMPRPIPLVLVVLAASTACAQGSTDPGEARDNCLRRDCGVAVGGQEVDPEEDVVYDDDGLPIEDTATTTKDSGPVDTGKADTGPTDAACAPPSGVVCTTFPQCGCPSQACDVTGTDGKTACVPAGTRGRHQRCTDYGQCARGFSCVYDVCMPFCGATSDCSAAVCRNVQYVDPVSKLTKDIPGFRVCMAQCDPINPTTACGSSTTCLFTSSTATTCAAAATSTTAGTCAADPFACAPGYVCVGTGDCKRWCRIGFTGDCPTGKTCGKLTTAPTIGTIEYGVCSY